jgi:hypothetical protein
LKTKGWKVVGGPGSYRLVPPGTKAERANAEANGTGDAGVPVERATGAGRAPP